MSNVLELDLPDLTQAAPAALQTAALRALEAGDVLLFPRRRFVLDDAESRAILAPLLATSKNVSFDPKTGQLRGTEAEAGEQPALKAMMQRFGDTSRALLHALMPRYDGGLQQGRISFRPAEIEGRRTSWRKDDTRLHVDSFPSSPVRGKRILRVFSNVNPHGQSRIWNLGERFEQVAQRFMPAVPAPLPGSAALLGLLHITKTRRSAYDHFMLQLHDRMKADLQYQADVPKTQHAFPPDTTWMVYTDQASHAALRGQYALEQTYYVDVQVMLDAAQSPLRVLEKLRGHTLV